jgi:transcriptional regulator with XRE-family HTH domain
MNLGERIFQLRTEKNMSQGDLADKLDVSRQSVSKWENNTAVPDLDKLIKLCDVFEISLDEITGRKVQKEKTSNKLEEIKEIKNSLTQTQQIGCILLCVGLVCALIFPILSPSILICGTICLTVKKNPWYWCIWVIFIPLLFVIGLSLAINFISNIIEIAFLVVMAFATYKAFKDTEIVMSKKKAILILVLSIVIDLLYIFVHLWRMGVFGTPGSTTTVILDNGQTVSTEMVTTGLVYGLINMFLTAGVGLSYIGIFLSAKNLRKKDECHSERSEESQS